MISPIGAPKANSGLTLVELLLVIIVLGIVLALSAPNFSKGYAHFQLNQTADDLLHISRWAQAMAIGQQRAYALRFAEDGRAYKLMRAKEGQAEDEEDSFEPVNGSLGRPHPVPEAVRVDVQPSSIQFHPDGTIDPASIVLDSSAFKTTLSSSTVRGMMIKEDHEE